MKPILYRTFLLCASLVAASLGANAAVLINVNFGNTGTSVAGVYGSSGQVWNTINSNPSAGYTYSWGPLALADSTGAGTSVAVAFSGDAYGSPNYGYSGFDYSLFANQLITHGTTTDSIDFTGLAAGTYSLVVYSNNFTGSTTTFDANGTPETLVDVQNNSAFQASPGNYLQLDVVVTSSGDLNLTNFNAGSQGVSGLQLEAIPEPSTWALMAFGLGFLGFFLRRRNCRA